MRNQTQQNKNGTNQKTASKSIYGLLLKSLKIICPAFQLVTEDPI